MSQDRNEGFHAVSGDDVMVPEVSSSTPDIYETRSPDSTSNLLAGTTDSNDATSISQEVADEYSNTGDLVVGTTDSNDASSSTLQEVTDEYSNAGDLEGRTTDGNVAMPSTLHEVADEYSNTDYLMVGDRDGSDASSSISQEVPDEYSNIHNISTVEDHSIAGELRELELSVSSASSDDHSRSEDFNISTPITSSPIKMEAVDQTKQSDDNKKEILLSPSKRRHFSSKHEPESKKLNTSGESDLVLSATNYGAELKTLAAQSPVDSLESLTEAIPQRVGDPVLDNLKPKTDSQGCTASNDANETAIFKVPPIPSPKKHTNQNRKNKLKMLAFLDSTRLSWEEHMQRSRDRALNLTSRAIPSGSRDANQGNFQYQKEIGKKSQFEVTSLGHQPQESSNSTVASNTEQSDPNMGPVSYSFPIILPVEIQPLARNDFIPELESIVNEYLNGLPTESLSEPIVEEHLRPFQTQFIERLNEFQTALEQTFSGIRNLEFSPDLNVSSLVIATNGLLRAAVDIECLWGTFAELLAENSNSINVINMTSHQIRCIQYFNKFMLAILRYFHTLPDDYPGV